MIEFIFYLGKNKKLNGFLVKGHANFSSKGSDIVCAGVSAVVEMCCNAITEILKKEVLIECEEGRIFLKMQQEDEDSQMFLKALKLEISLLEKQYEKNIKLRVLEEG